MSMQWHLKWIKEGSLGTASLLIPNCLQAEGAKDAWKDVKIMKKIVELIKSKQNRIQD